MTVTGLSMKLNSSSAWAPPAKGSKNTTAREMLVCGCSDAYGRSEMFRLDAEGAFVFPKVYSMNVEYSQVQVSNSKGIHVKRVNPRR